MPRERCPMVPFCYQQLALKFCLEYPINVLQLPKEKFSLLALGKQVEINMVIKLWLWPLKIALGVYHNLQEKGCSY